jgi:hypothetical protein
VFVEDRLVDVLDADCRESLGRFPRMAFWPPEVEWHERDVVVPAFRRWLETQGWETETETGFVDVVAHRGNETIYAEVKGRTKSRPGAGLDTLYGQLLRRMPVEEVGDPNTRFAVVIPTGAEAAALRVPRRVRDLLRIDIYAVSDDGQVEKLSDSEALEVEREAEKLAGETVAPSRPKKAAKSDWKSWPNPEKLEYLLRKTTIPDRAHTDEQRLPGEKRADFLRRIYG